MKTILTFIFALFLSTLLFAQSPPQLFNFQAVARDAEGNPIEGETIIVTYRILQGGPTGTVVDDGFGTPTTGPGGLFSLEISGTQFEGILWEEGPMFLEVSIDGVTATQQLVSVPYALYALKSADGQDNWGVQVVETDQTLAGNGAETPLSIAQQGAEPGMVLQWTGTQWQPQFAGIPPGTIIAYGGDINNIPLGWRFCDGSLISNTEPGYANLFAAIGNNFGGNSTEFNLPDFRGRFLRGVDNNPDDIIDPDVTTRTEMNPGGNTGGFVGSVQVDATRLPNDNFELSTNGNHSHTGTANAAGNHSHTGDTSTDGNHSHTWTRPYSTDEGGNGLTSILWDDQNMGNKQTGTSSNGNHKHDLDINNAGTHTHSLNIGSAGNHNHNITGGDNESRPKNAYVHYIIKL